MLFSKPQTVLAIPNQSTDQNLIGLLFSFPFEIVEEHLQLNVSTSGAASWIDSRHPCAGWMAWQRSISH